MVSRKFFPAIKIFYQLILNPDTAEKWYGVKLYSFLLVKSKNLRLSQSKLSKSDFWSHLVSFFLHNQKNLLKPGMNGNDCALSQPQLFAINYSSAHYVNRNDYCNWTTDQCKFDFWLVDGITLTYRKPPMNNLTYAILSTTIIWR